MLSILDDFMIEDHDTFLISMIIVWCVMNFGFIKRKLIRVWSKKKFHHMREKYFLNIESIRGSYMKLNFKWKIYLNFIMRIWDTHLGKIFGYSKYHILNMIPWSFKLHWISSQKFTFLGGSKVFWYYC